MLYEVITEKALEDSTFVTALAKSGCRMLQLGLESGSQRVLDRLDNRITSYNVCYTKLLRVTRGFADSRGSTTTGSIVKMLPVFLWYWRPLFAFNPAINLHRLQDQALEIFRLGEREQHRVIRGLGTGGYQPHFA